MTIEKQTSRAQSVNATIKGIISSAVAPDSTLTRVLDWNAAP